LLRSAPSLNVVVTMLSAAGETNAAPRPCSARGDEPELALGQSAEQRGAGEEDHPRDEEPAAAQQVGQAAAQQQEAAEDQGVGVDDPRQVVLLEVQVAADRGQRDVDDRGVEDDDELRAGQEGEREPLGWGGGRRGHGGRRYGTAVPLVKFRARVRGMSADATDARPLRADARRNRERIMDAAGGCFAECGMAAQMDDVARRAGVGVGTVYRHFPTKDALVGEIIRRRFAEMADVARRWNAVEDPWEAFCGMVSEIAEQMARDRTQQTLMWVATEAARRHADEAKQALREAAETLVTRAKDAGALRADFTIDDLPTIMCALGGTMSAGNPAVADWRRLLGFVLQGLRAPA
jgi:AcrR family transcriptional regulator